MLREFFTKLLATETEAALEKDLGSILDGVGKSLERLEEDSTR